MARFLRDLDEFRRYMDDVPTGLLALPDYKRDADNRVIVHHGEVFCRVRDCRKSKHVFNETGNLRVHVRAHEGIEISPTNVTKGRHSVAQEDQVVAFFKSLYGPTPPATGTATITSLPKKTSPTPHRVAKTISGKAAKPEIPLTKRDQVSIRGVKGWLRTEKGIAKFPACNSCKLQKARCLTMPFTCTYLQHFDYSMLERPDGLVDISDAIDEI
ncbi:hypothetical protein N7495_007760 [Penicillium taxi]|uniref:uncharacterized protein n=1 Tax=Penicillium taxi TaxID=168475 RepID=UPI002545A7FA|nr:uncharacterized protein N7495_007760 [Penicillium taxi]KAJ5887719.1 hypothetical protein N7495_007760 [Penicillium taxi]